MIIKPTELIETFCCEALLYSNDQVYVRNGIVGVRKVEIIVTDSL